MILSQNVNRGRRFQNHSARVPSKRSMTVSGRFKKADSSEGGSSGYFQSSVRQNSLQERNTGWITSLSRSSLRPVHPDLGRRPCLHERPPVGRKPNKYIAIRYTWN